MHRQWKLFIFVLAILSFGTLNHQLIGRFFESTDTHTAPQSPSTDSTSDITSGDQSRLSDERFVSKKERYINELSRQAKAVTLEKKQATSLP